MSAVYLCLLVRMVGVYQELDYRMCSICFTRVAGQNKKSAAGMVAEQFYGFHKQVYDVTALRVVVTNKHDCYVALRVVQVRKGASERKELGRYGCRTLYCDAWLTAVRATGPPHQRCLDKQARHLLG